MASDFETIILQENWNPAVKLEPLYDDDQNKTSAYTNCPTAAAADESKIGEIFYVTKDHFKFVCVHCFAEFALFPLFSVHVQQHLHEIYAQSIEPHTKADSEIVEVKPATLDCIAGPSVEIIAETYSDYAATLEPPLAQEKELIQCSDCDKHFQSRTSLKKHFSNAHSRMYICTLCDTYVRHKRNLIRHFRNQHPQNDPNLFRKVVRTREQIEPMAEESRRKRIPRSTVKKVDTQRNQIQKSVSEMQARKRKWPRVKLNASAGVLTCPDCEQRFERQSLLLEHHEIVHQGRLFACSVCHTKLTHKHNMFRHMRKQHPLVDVNAFQAVYDNDEQTNPNVRTDQRPVKRKSARLRNVPNGVKRVNVKRNAEGGFDCSSDCDEEKIYCCTICNTKLRYKRNIIRHVRNKHPANDVELNSDRNIFTDDDLEIIDFDIKPDISNEKWSEI